MKVIVVVTALIAGVLVFSISYLGRRTTNGPRAMSAESPAPDKNAKPSPVVVELFTSEGCSSCPPADKLLASLADAQPVTGATVIALEQHVDYWNQLGWKDPYSSEQFSARQQGYSSRFGADGVYTPQMIVDGQSEFVGSSTESAQEAISKASRVAKADVQLSLEPANEKDPVNLPVRLNAHFKGVPAPSKGDRVEVLLAVTEDKLDSSITRGENSGLTLRHFAVVRRLDVVTSVDSDKVADFNVNPTIAIANSWKRENLRAVVFLQEHDTRKILGAGEISLAR